MLKLVLNKIFLVKLKWSEILIYNIKIYKYIVLRNRKDILIIVNYKRVTINET